MTEDKISSLFTKIDHYLKSQSEEYFGIPVSAKIAPLKDEITLLEQRLAQLEEQNEAQFDYEISVDATSSEVEQFNYPLETEDALLEQNDLEPDEPAFINPEFSLQTTTDDSELDDEIDSVSEEFPSEIEEFEEEPEILLSEEQGEGIRISDVPNSNASGEESAGIFNSEQSYSKDDTDSESPSDSAKEETVEEKPYVDPMQFDLFGPAPTPTPAKSKSKEPTKPINQPGLFDIVDEKSDLSISQKFEEIPNPSKTESQKVGEQIELTKPSEIDFHESLVESDAESHEVKPEIEPIEETTSQSTFSELQNSDLTLEIPSVEPHTSLIMPVNDSLQKELNACTTLEELRELCEKHRSILQTDLPNTNLVFGVGNPVANLMIVGEAPGENEDIQGEPFVGKAGQLLDKIMEAIQFQRKDIYIANILKHRPPKNRDPYPEERERSLPFLIRQIEIIQPKIILCLGRISARTLLGLQDNVSLAQLRGKFHPFLDGKVELTATYHPASLLRNPNWKRPTWEDVQMVRKRHDELVG